MRGVELYLFKSGTLVLGGVVVPVPFFLVRHPEGDVVVDGGNPLALAYDPRSHWGGAMADTFDVRMSEGQHCAAQLRRLDVGPESVRYVVQTHLHADHTGALGHFPGATFVVHTRELQAARAAASPVDSGYVHADFDRPEIRWQLAEGELDLFGDGTVRLIETPGHSAGHMSLLVHLDKTGPVLVTADAADNRAQWEGREPPRGMYSPEDARRSLELLRQIALQTDPLIVFGHDADNWPRLTHAPHGYS